MCGCDERTDGRMDVANDLLVASFYLLADALQLAPQLSEPKKTITSHQQEDKVLAMHGTNSSILFKIYFYW